ncbi:MAG TPA: ATP-binding protein [Candidatus Dormibacteraeota bacterium]|nr:ATP-binding protein [Candidatus Dormibacteraeota bacterium]
MGSLLYLRLIGYTAGTLLQLFWMVVILGYRRQRNFERVFFFLCLALFFFYGGSLLALNSQIYYPQPPEALADFATAVISVGLCLLPALLLHLHLEYAQTRGLLRYREWKRAVLLVFYALGVHLAFHRVPLLLEQGHFDYVVPGRSLGPGFAMTLAVSLAWCAGWEKRFANNAPDRPQRLYHWLLFSFFVASFLAVAGLHMEMLALRAPTTETLAMIFVLLPILPFTVLIYLVQRHNFLQIGRQKNLVFAVSVTFLALLYLSLVRRLSEWLAPVLPPEASASVLLFLLVLIIEPLQRFLGRRLQETAQREMNRVQALSSQIRQEARQGQMTKLLEFIERHTKEEFELASVKLTLAEQDETPTKTQTVPPIEPDTANQFELREGGRVIAILLAEPHGAAFSGETRAALEFLCEQLPGALDLCRLIEEKLALERELAQRERLALVGQTAASISHNLKNPLGSIKTILQVQLENPEMPESMKGETKMVLDEIARLSATLNQLLQFSRPAVRGSSENASCDAARVVEEVTALLRHEAERRGIALSTNTTAAASMVAASAEAVNDIVSNLLVNALEAAPRNGHVWVTLQNANDACEIRVADDGPGIPEAVRSKIVQPFFTTKARGTGLGLAIVARRAAEFGGKLDWDSRAETEAGAIFAVTLPLQKSN